MFMFGPVGLPSPSWSTMECYLFILVTHLELVCSRWSLFEGALHMALEFSPAMAQESQVKQSWQLLNIRASIWLQRQEALPGLI